MVVRWRRAIGIDWRALTTRDPSGTHLHHAREDLTKGEYIHNPTRLGVLLDKGVPTPAMRGVLATLFCARIRSSFCRIQTKVSATIHKTIHKTTWIRKDARRPGPLQTPL